MFNASNLISPMVLCTLGIAVYGYLKYNFSPEIGNDKNEIDRLAQQNINLTLEAENKKQFAATKIQSACRGHLIRLVLKKLQAENLITQKNSNAIKIQSSCRGYLGRERAKKHFLNYALFEKAKQYVDNPSQLRDMPRASSGRTRVYLPKELPIVLKQSGSPANLKRLDQMKQAREICQKKKLQSSCYSKSTFARKFYY